METGATPGVPVASSTKKSRSNRSGQARNLERITGFPIGYPLSAERRVFPVHASFPHTMRIAHLTLLHGFNYGGILQAYATQKILRAHGHEVVTLDYHTAKRIILARKLTLNIRFVHEKIRWLLDTWQFSGVKEFNDFRARHFQFSASCCNARQLTRACRGFDAVAVGSDQVWSPSWVRPPFFLDFDLEPACKRISLAACCGQPTDDPDFLRYFAKTISRFDALSVRNEFTAEMVRKATGRTAEVVFDPTLATDFPSEPVPGISDPYILVYVINRGDSVPLAMEAPRIKAATGLQVYCIPPAETKDDSALPVDRVIRRITPFSGTI